MSVTAPNITTAPPASGRSRGRAYFWAGIGACLLGLGLFVAQLGLKQLVVPWYSPVLATVGVGLLFAAVAARLSTAVAEAVGASFAVSVTNCMSQIGSGALPLETLDSAGLAVKPIGRKGAGSRLEALSVALRSLPIPVIGRVNDGALVLDLRCLDDEAGFAAQLGQLRKLLARMEAPDVPA